MAPRLLPLASGFTLPALGLGTWRLTGSEAYRTVRRALEVGYRHVDTADHYGNHREVGRAIRDSGCERSEVFITTKVWHDRLRRRDVLADTARFLDELDTDYLDLVLIHWPNSRVPIGETLGALDAARRAGAVRSIGVSNFTVAHLDRARATGVAVCVNQVEFHPTFNQDELRRYCAAHDIVLTAYSPLGRGVDVALPPVTALAEKYRCTNAEVILAWLLAKGVAVIPKAADLTHLEQNFRALTLELAPEDVAAIDRVRPHDRRLINPPFAEFTDPPRATRRGLLAARLLRLLRLYR
jgi:2,5-diketo-D-gluconate reductase B